MSFILSTQSRSFVGPRLPPHAFDYLIKKKQNKRGFMIDYCNGQNQKHINLETSAFYSTLANLHFQLS